MPNNDWVRNFITVDDKGLFVAWDETASIELGRFETYRLAEEMILFYAKSLDQG